LIPYKLWNLYVSNPGYFRAETATDFTTAANQRRKFNETIQAGFVRADANFMDNRLLLVGGVRFEQTVNDGLGPLNDVRATLVQDANGNLIRDANGRTIPVTTDPLTIAQLRYKTLAGKAGGKYHGYYPSFNVKFNLTDAWIARASYAKAIGRPALGSILPGTTITDPDVANPLITVNNPALKPWSADSYELSLETYFGANGMASVSAYRKQLTGFFASTRVDATEALLNEFSLPLDYLTYDIVTMNNINQGVTIDRLELSYTQALAFLPNWARGLRVNGSLTLKKLEGPSAATLQDFGGNTANWGIALNRSRYSVRFNWSYRGEFRTGAIGANSLAEYRSKEVLLDMSAEARLTKRFTLPLPQLPCRSAATRFSFNRTLLVATVTSTGVANS